jgi:IS1 family transposase
MCTTGLKKTEQNKGSEQIFYELDELWWFVGKKARTDTRENTYLMTMVSREPRQIVGFDVAYDKAPERIQAIVDSAPDAEYYCSDGDLGYIDVVYPGHHIRCVANKSDTFTVEGINADLRHHIPLLRRKSRCFARKIETLYAVLDVFVEAYNKFGEYKQKYRVPVVHRSEYPAGRLHKWRDPPCSVLDFI